MKKNQKKNWFPHSTNNKIQLKLVWRKKTFLFSFKKTQKCSFLTKLVFLEAARCLHNLLFLSFFFSEEQIRFPYTIRFTLCCESSLISILLRNFFFISLSRLNGFFWFFLIFLKNHKFNLKNKNYESVKKIHDLELKMKL